MRMIGGLAAMLLLAGCDGASGTDLGAARAADTANARAIKVTAMEISQAFLRNAEKARQTYDNRVLYVSGARPERPISMGRHAMGFVTDKPNIAPACRTL